MISEEERDRLMHARTMCRKNIDPHGPSSAARHQSLRRSPVPQQYWIAIIRPLASDETTALKHSPRAVISRLRRKRLHSKRLNMTDQGRSQPTAPKGSGHYDIQNAYRVLLENEHSLQRRTFSQCPDQPCLALTLHPFQEPMIFFRTADISLKADLRRGRAQQINEPRGGVLRGELGRERGLVVSHVHVTQSLGGRSVWSNCRSYEKRLA
jgi:hypothetical protein